jgi:hypothetical protein
MGYRLFWFIEVLKRSTHGVSSVNMAVADVFIALDAIEIILISSTHTAKSTYIEIASHPLG